MLQIQSEHAHGHMTMVALDAEQGGVVCSYYSTTTAGEVHWFAPSGQDHPSCFAMAPFCSRISNASFCYENQEVKLTPNNPPEPHALHGHGFQRAWQVLEQQRDSVLLAYEHQADAWPWSYRATARYALQGMCLRVALSVENLSARAMPVGLGLHPYLPRDGVIELQANCGHWLELDAELLPVALHTPPAELELRAGLKLGPTALDHVFTGWDGIAHIEWRAKHEADSASRQLSMFSSCPYLVVWAPAGRDFFCVEGVSNLPDAFNGKVAHLLQQTGGGEGFTRLDAGHVHRCTWDFVPQLPGIG